MGSLDLMPKVMLKMYKITLTMELQEKLLGLYLKQYRSVLTIVFNVAKN